MADSQFVECPDCQARCGADENVCWVCHAALWDRSRPPSTLPPVPEPRVRKPLPVLSGDIAYTSLPRPQETVASDLGLSDGVIVAAFVAVLGLVCAFASGGDATAIALLVFGLLIAASAALQRNSPARGRAEKLFGIMAGAIALGAMVFAALMFAAFTTCILAFAGHH